MKVKIGDRVRVRTWEAMEAEYGLDDEGFIPVGEPDCPCYLAPDQKQFCGKPATVADFYVTGGRQIVYLEFDHIPMKNVLWLFSAEMLEKYEPADSDPSLLDADLSDMVSKIGSE